MELDRKEFQTLKQRCIDMLYENEMLKKKWKISSLTKWKHLTMIQTGTVGNYVVFIALVKITLVNAYMHFYC